MNNIIVASNETVAVPIKHRTRKTECLVPGSALPPREFKRSCALRCARGLRAVTDGVAVVTPQARDDFWT